MPCFIIIIECMLSTFLHYLPSDVHFWFLLTISHSYSHFNSSFSEQYLRALNLSRRTLEPLEISTINLKLVCFVLIFSDVQMFQQVYGHTIILIKTFHWIPYFLFNSFKFSCVRTYWLQIPLIRVIKNMKKTTAKKPTNKQIIPPINRKTKADIVGTKWNIIDSRASSCHA